MTQLGLIVIQKLSTKTTNPIITTKNKTANNKWVLSGGVELLFKGLFAMMPMIIKVFVVLKVLVSGQIKVQLLPY